MAQVTLRQTSNAFLFRLIAARSKALVPMGALCTWSLAAMVLRDPFYECAECTHAYDPMFAKALTVFQKSCYCHLNWKIDSACSSAHLIETMAKANHGASIGALAVSEEGRIQGIVTKRDIMHHIAVLGRDPRTTPIREICTWGREKLVSVHPKKAIHDVMKKFIEHNTRHLFVEAPDGSDDQEFSGLVSIRDCLKFTR